MRARYYDPTIGRFISRDPVRGALSNPQSLNPYSYSLNNPVNLSDPSGRYAEDPVVQSSNYFILYQQNPTVFFLPIFEIPSLIIAEGAEICVQVAQQLRGTQNPAVQQAVKKGMEKHAEFYKAAEEAGMVANKAVFPNSLLRPDAVDFSNKLIYELKPQWLSEAERQLQEYVRMGNKYFTGG